MERLEKEWTNYPVLYIFRTFDRTQIIFQRVKSDY